MRRPGLSPLEVLNLFPAHDGTLGGLVASRAATRGQETFLLFRDRRWSWGTFVIGVERVAASLRRKGVEPGDRVAVMSANSDAVLLVWFGLARLGAVLVPMSAEATVEEAAYVLGHAGPRFLCLSAATAGVGVEASAALAAPPERLALEEGEASVLAAASDPALSGLPDPSPVDPEAPGQIIYTSGTTGLPRGVVHSQRSAVVTGEAFVERMRLSPADRVLCVLPLCHVNALFYSVAGAVAAGASLVLAPRFSASDFWRGAADSGATTVNIIAAVGRILMRRPACEFRPGHRLAKIYGAPVSAEDAHIFRDRFAVKVVVEGYGTTEVPGALTNPFDASVTWGRLGLAARHPDPSRPFAEAMVADEDGRPVPDGDVGELLVRTPVVMKGYYRDPAATAAAFHPGGWFRTGDLVRRDAQGFYHFEMRKKDIIRVRGENVSAAEVERAASAHPGVAEATAVAVPAELGEDEILLVVVPKTEAAVDERELGAWCRARLGPRKAPRYVACASVLPRTATARVAKHKLANDPALKARWVDISRA